MEPNTRKIKIGRISGVNSLKIQILSSLKILDFHKDCVNEFDVRIVSYLDRNKKLAIQVDVFLTNVEEGIKKQAIIDNTEVRYPSDFQFGLPNMATNFMGSPKSSDEIELERIKIEKQTKKEFQYFIKEVNRLSEITRFKINLI